MPYEGERILTPAESLVWGRPTPTGPVAPLASPLNTPPTEGPFTLQPRPDFIGRAKAWLTREPPAGAKSLFGETETPGRIVRGLGDILLPGSVPEVVGQAATLAVPGGPLSGPLKRAAIGGLASGAAGAIQGHDPLSTGGAFAGGQATADLLMSPLRLRANQKAFDVAQQGFLTQVQKLKSKFEFDSAMTKTLNTVEAQIHEGNVQAAKVGYEKALEKWGTQGATRIVEDFQKRVPAWKGFSRDERGLLDITYGEGQAALSTEFDKALQAAVSTAGNKTIRLPVDIVEKLGVIPMSKNMPGMLPGVIVTKGGKRISPPEVDLSMVEVNAGDVLPKVVGYWKKDPGTYRRVTRTLDEAGIGNADARAAYRAGQGLIQFMDKAKLLEGGSFHPDRVLSGLTQLKKLEELRRRGQGDIFKGPLAETGWGVPPKPSAPVAPQPRPEPVMPAQPQSPQGFETVSLPKIPHPWYTGGMAAELPAALFGHHGYGAPFAAGGLLANLLSGRQFVTKAPGQESLSDALRTAAAILGQTPRHTEPRQD